MATQRWRLTLRRSAASAELSQRDLLDCWAATLRAAGLVPWPPSAATSGPAAIPGRPVADGPAARSGGSAPGSVVTEPRLLFGAPLPLRTTADGELVDLLLPDRLTSAELRARLAPNLPPGHDLVDLYDVWIGEPALPGLVVAADYRVTIRAASGVPDPAERPDRSAPGATIDAAELDWAIGAVLAATVIARDRAGKAALNIRPLIIGMARDPAATESVLLLRLRLDPTLGSGRPDDVVATLGARLGGPIEVVAQRRARLWLRGERQDESDTQR